MANYRRPGTYVEEVLLPQQVDSQGSSTFVGAFLGTSDRGPTAATLVSSWTEFVRIFGSFNVNHNLHFALYSFFSNGGRSAYVARVLGTGSASASVTLSDRAGSPLNTMSVTAINAGTWANSSNTTTGLSVEVKDNNDPNRFDLLVYQGSTSNVVERFHDLSMDNNDGRYAVRQINGTSDYIVVADLNSATAAPGDRPAAAGVKALSAGADGTTPAAAVYTAVLTQGNSTAAFDVVLNSMVLNIPDVQRLDDTSAAQILQAASAYADARGDVFVVADTTANATSAALAGTFATSVMAGAGMTGQNMAMYFPFLVVPDPIGSQGATRTVAPGGAVVGMYLATDSVRGVFKAPAGMSLPFNNVVAPALRLSNTDLDNLNTAQVPINAIRSIPGAGICVMGARTLRTIYTDRYVSVRRTLIYIKKTLVAETEFAIFESNDERLWERLRTVANTFLQGLWQQGGLKGMSAADAFYVKCDATINTPAVIGNGEVRVEIGVATQTPAEFVVLRIGQFDGGTTVVTQQ